MSANKGCQPWFKFYTTDWRGDPLLRSVSYAARGLWIDMLSMMHEADTYGHLLVNGKPPTLKQFSAIFGGKERQISELLSELEAAGVFSRTDAGVIYSRRMVRDFEKAKRDKENGKGGGNPALRQSPYVVVGGRDGPGGVNPPDKADDNASDKPGDKARARAFQIPDTRVQIPEEKKEQLPLEACPKNPLYTPDFEEWWSAYPDRPNDNKATAAKAYAKACKSVSAGFLLEQLRAYRFNEVPRYRRMAATWLNEQSWEDRNPAPKPTLKSRMAWMFNEDGSMRPPEDFIN